MATHTGSSGIVKVGTAAIAEIRSYSIEEAAEVIESTSMGDTSRTYDPGLKTFSGSMECFWDETDANGQVALAIGSSATINVYPEGEEAGDTYYGGAIIVTGITVGASYDGQVERSITFQGTGALTITTV